MLMSSTKLMWIITVLHLTMEVVRKSVSDEFETKRQMLPTTLQSDHTQRNQAITTTLIVT